MPGKAKPGVRQGSQYKCLFAAQESVGTWSSYLYILYDCVWIFEKKGLYFSGPQSAAVFSLALIRQCLRTSPIILLQTESTVVEPFHISIFEMILDVGSGVKDAQHF